MKKESSEISRQPFLGFLLLYSIVVVCYLPVFSNGFLNSWDDQWMVTNIYTENGWTVKNLTEIFTQSYKGQYSPLVQLNYIMLYTIFGYEPFWFHFTNVVWHCGCITLIFFFIRQLLKQSNQVNSNDSLQIAYLVAFLFAIHPVNVETVAWISAVKVSMYTFFYLLALLLHLRYVMSLKITYYIIAILCFVGSGLSKEQAFIFPLTLLLIDWFIGRNIKTLDTCLEKLPFFIISAVFAFLTWNLQGQRSETVSYAVEQRIFFGCYSLFEYITKSLIPVNLNYLYPFPIHQGDMNLPFRFYIYPILTIGLLSILLYFRKNRIIIFGSLFFILHLLLSLHIVSIPRLAIVADRYLYMSLIGILLIISFTSIVFVKNLRVKSRKIIFSVLFLFYSFYLGSYTYYYSKNWIDTDTLKEYLYKFHKDDTNKNKSKSCINHYQLSLIKKITHNEKNSIYFRNNNVALWHGIKSTVCIE